MRVTVDVCDKTSEVPVIVNNPALEGAFKQGTGSLICFIESLGIGNEQIVELAAWIQGLSSL